MHRAAVLALGVAALAASSAHAADAPPPLAHAILERSLPAAGDTLAEGPAEVVLTFSGMVEQSGATLRLLGPDDRVWSLTPRRPPDDSRTLAAEVPALAPGGYRVEWRVVSADGHPIGGNLVFFVEGDVEGGLVAPPASGTPSGEIATTDGGRRLAAALVATRAAADAALLPLAGLLLFAAWANGATTPLTDRTARILSVVAPLMVASHVWLWAGDVLGGGSGRLTGLISLTTGRALAAEAVLAALIPWALLLARRVGLAAGMAFVAVAAGGFGGHPASYTPLVSVPASIAHVSAAALWLGGLALLVTERGSVRYEITARRVSSAALVAVGVVTATGVVQTLAILGPPARLFASAFGIVVLAKVAGLAALIAFGAHHRFRLIPEVGSSDGALRLSRSVSRELVTAVCVVVLAALLSHIPPTV